MFVPFVCDDEVLRIGRGLVDRTLPKSSWTHAAHFAAAIWTLAEKDISMVSREFPKLVRQYNESTGVANTETSGYHETITQASLRAANYFVQRGHGKPLFAIYNAVMTSELGASDWLLVYWSRARLFSVEARREWREPDLRNFPF